MSISKALPSMEHTFNVEIKGEDTGKTYTGEFTYKRPTIGQKIEIVKLATRLNGDLENLPHEIKIINEMSAHMHFCLSTAENWWVESNDGKNLYDSNVIQEIYAECMKFENEWTDKVWNKSNEEIASEPKSA